MYKYDPEWLYRDKTFSEYVISKNAITLKCKN